MKITVIGGGPGGLYYSILTKKRLPDSEIEIFEQNNPDDAFGFGVVFSDETLSEFLSYDQESYDLIRNKFAYWDNLDIVRNEDHVRIRGNGFCGCSRKTLLNLLQQRCADLGIKIHFKSPVNSLEKFKDSDIVVAADGINSGIRGGLEKEFGTTITLKSNRFVWCGSTKPLDAFTYFFKSSNHGEFVAHTYQYEEGKSTWIFECSNETYQNAGFEIDNEEKTLAYFENLYQDILQGHKLISNRSHWRQFPHVENENWNYKNIVLLGDAKATAHYSIGSGTKLAMDCAIGLSDATVKFQNDVPKIFEEYNRKRRNPVEMIQHAALVSLAWFENMKRHFKLDFDTFSFSVMSRSKKITIENQHRRDPEYADRILHNFNKINHSKSLDFPPAFTPFQLGSLKIQNRIVMSPMGQYCAENGLVNDWHFVHYTTRALGNVGLIIAEMSAISPTGRITPACLGLWNDAQMDAWKKTIDFIHGHTDTKFGIQIGHSGRKGSCKPTNLSKTLTENGWPLVSASDMEFKEGFPVPKELSIDELQEIKNQFVHSVKLAVRAGFDLLEIQCHNGFLLASFISPLTNKRTDQYGGSLDKRLAFPLEVIQSVIDAIGKDFPLSVRITATDWHPEGSSQEEVIFFAKKLKDLGVSIINVNTGNTVIDQKPIMGRMWQTPFAEMVRNEVDIPTITTGNIQDIDQVNTLLLNVRADLIALGRPLLADPYFTIRAQAYEHYEAERLSELNIPRQYRSGVEAIYQLYRREKKEIELMKLALKPVSHQKTN